MGKVDFGKIAGFEFECGAYISFGSQYEVKVEAGPDGPTASAFVGFRTGGPVPFTPEMAEKLAGLLDGCGVGDWERSYEPPADLIVYDGYYWNLRIVLEGGTVIEAEGSNGWPEGYGRFEEGLVELFGVPEGADPRVVPGKKGLIPDSYRYGSRKPSKSNLDENGDVIPG